MKHLAIPATLTVSGEQPETVISEYKCMSPGGAFEDFLVDPLGTMGIEEAHKIEDGIAGSACGTSHANELSRTFVYNKRISRTHISISTLANRTCSITIDI